MLGIGLPAGAEFALMAVYMFVVYTVSRPFGSAAQAGFGIGLRIIQAGFMPVVALGFAVAPVAGQNFGAQKPNACADVPVGGDAWRRRVMLALMLLVRARRTAWCTSSPPILRWLPSASEYLRILCWTFIMSGIVFVGSSMFQAMGNTLPSLVASFTRIVLVAVPAFIVARMPGFELRWIWYLSLAAGVVQFVLTLVLLEREFRRKLNPMEVAVTGGV